MTTQIPLLILAQMRRAFLHCAVPILIGFACCLFQGCKPSVSESYSIALSSEQAAKTAWEAKDPKAARKASGMADRAASVLDQAAAKARNGSAGEDLRKQASAAQAAARSARKYAETAEQEHARQTRLNGLMAKTYATGRRLVLNSVVPQMVGAATKASEQGVDNLSATDRPFAELAWLCLHATVNTPAPTNAAPEWAAAASSIRPWNTNPPVEFRLALVWAFAAAGANGFALFELESIAPETIQNQECRYLHSVSKGIYYSIQGWNRLAAAEFEALAKQVGEKNEPIDGDALVALVHGVQAYQAMKDRDWGTMDGEIAESMRVWPNNPISVYLTGERLAANGEWEKAASSFESSVAGTTDEWLAKRLGDRARELRDGKGSAKTFVLDAPLLIEFGLHLAFDKMAGTPAGKQLRTTLSRIRNAGEELRQKIKMPGPASEAIVVTNTASKPA